MEVIVAVAIALVAIVGVLILLSQATRSIRAAENRMIAGHLAQEAIEVVVAIRDSNWSAGQNWRTNIPSGEGIVDYDSTSVVPESDPSDWCLGTQANVYQHGVACNTLFSRHVEVTDFIDDIGGNPVPYIEVKAVVTWIEAGGPLRTVTAVNELYDWR